MVRLCLFLSAVLLAAGCAGQTLEVEGDVLFDGQPVDNGGISFEPADGKGPEFGGTIVAGHYKASGPPGMESGKRIVRIRGSRKTGKQVPAGPPHPPGTMIDEVVFVPSTISDSGSLSVDLTVGKVNRADFHLKSAAQQP